MRVVSGTAGGIPLLAPKTDLRPTMDRVKGAIFDSLGERVIGARVLDLFAGAGGLGIEALSRGAASATMVEKEARAVEAIHRNLEKTRLKGAIVHTLDIFSFLHRLAPEGGYDIIIADPPYAKKKGERDFSAELLGDPLLPRALAPDGLFILEKLPGAKLGFPPCWELIRERRYGATEVATFRLASAPASSDPEAS
jgi:16S rRNA (guanine966-N2)-methyltransferase